MPTTFFVESYPEWENCFAAKEYAESKDYEWLMIKHYGEVKEDGSEKKEHYHTLVRTPNDMSVSAFSKNSGVEQRWIRERNNWRETARYMVHLSDSAVREGKKVFDYEELEGPLKDRAIEYIKKKMEPGRVRSSEDDKGILQILDYIDSFDYLPTAALCRWCCENGLYSTYRRAGRIVADILQEHNRHCEFTLKDTIYQMRLEQMEKRMSKAERELEKAYGDLAERMKNPFTGKFVWEEDEEFKESVALMDGQIKEILKGA